jgi:hypothetical protein
MAWRIAATGRCSARATWLKGVAEDVVLVPVVAVIRRDEYAGPVAEPPHAGAVPVAVAAPAGVLEVAFQPGWGWQVVAGGVGCGCVLGDQVALVPDLHEAGAVSGAGQAMRRRSGWPTGGSSPTRW